MSLLLAVLDHQIALIVDQLFILTPDFADDFPFLEGGYGASACFVELELSQNLLSTEESLNVPEFAGVEGGFQFS